MTLLLACIPVCLTFVSIALIGLVVVVFGLSNRVPIDDQPETTDGDPTVGGRPSLWLFPLMVLALVVALLLLSLVVEN